MKFQFKKHKTMLDWVENVIHKKLCKFDPIK